jgi:apolipoprotein N-acyltransferase
MAVFRAVEVRRSLVKIANSGQSGWIDAAGRRSLFEQEGRRDGFAWAAVVRPTRGSAKTIYARAGEWIGWVALFITAALCAGRRKRVADHGSAGAPVTEAGAASIRPSSEGSGARGRPGDLN